MATEDSPAATIARLLAVRDARSDARAHARLRRARWLRTAPSSAVRIGAAWHQLRARPDDPDAISELHRIMLEGGEVPPKSLEMCSLRLYFERDPGDLAIAALLADRMWRLGEPLSPPLAQAALAHALSQPDLKPGLIPRLIEGVLAGGLDFDWAALGAALVGWSKARAGDLALTELLACADRLEATDPKSAQELRLAALRARWERHPHDGEAAVALRDGLLSAGAPVDWSVERVAVDALIKANPQDQALAADFAARLAEHGDDGAWRAPLAARLNLALTSPAFAERCERIKAIPGGMTSTLEQAALMALIGLLAPARVLEIGTAFAHTTRLLSDAVLESGGSLVSIDPFGAERAPPLLAAWPFENQAVTTYKPLSSMDYFLSVEVAGGRTGIDAPFDLVFVDGHHSYDYALFDIIRSATYIRPGGAMVVDNIDQAGPRAAVASFLSHFPRWRHFWLEGQDDARPEFMPGGGGGILLAPLGLEVGRAPLKLDLFDLGSAALAGLALNRIDGATGELELSINLYAQSQDYQATGQGVVSAVRNLRVAVDPAAGGLAIPIAPPLTVAPPEGSTGVHAQVELTFIGAEGATILLDPRAPIRALDARES